LDIKNDDIKIIPFDSELQLVASWTNNSLYKKITMQDLLEITLRSSKDDLSYIKKISKSKI